MGDWTTRLYRKLLEDCHSKEEVIDLISKEHTIRLCNEMGQLQLIIPAVKPRGMLMVYSYLGFCYRNSFVLPPSSLKSVAKGRPVIMVPLVLFTDYTSGNK